MKPGRPPLSDEVRDLVLKLRETGMGYGAIAQKLGIGKTSVARIISHGKPSQNSREEAGRV